MKTTTCPPHYQLLKDNQEFLKAREASDEKHNKSQEAFMEQQTTIMSGMLQTFQKLQQSSLTTIVENTSEIAKVQREGAKTSTWKMTQGKIENAKNVKGYVFTLSGLCFQLWRVKKSVKVEEVKELLLTADISMETLIKILESSEHIFYNNYRNVDIGKLTMIAQSSKDESGYLVIIHIREFIRQQKQTAREYGTDDIDDVYKERAKCMLENMIGLKIDNHISHEKVKAKAKSTKPQLPRSSTLLKPTSSQLAKQICPTLSSRFQISLVQNNQRSLFNSSATAR